MLDQRFWNDVDDEFERFVSWTSAAHGMTLAAFAIRAVEEGKKHGLEERKLTVFVARSLDQHGLGGNASQFRQYLASEKGGRRIEKRFSKADKYAEEPEDESSDE